MICLCPGPSFNIKLCQAMIALQVQNHVTHSLLFWRLGSTQVQATDRKVRALHLRLRGSHCPCHKADLGQHTDQSNISVDARDTRQSELRLETNQHNCSINKKAHQLVVLCETQRLSSQRRHSFNIASICCGPEIAGDVIPRRNAKTIVASASSYRENQCEYCRRR